MTGDLVVARIPAPEDFAFDWADPADAERTWRHESTHCPEAMPALGMDLWEQIFAAISRAEEHYGSPMRLFVLPINTYVFYNDRMVVDADQVEAARECAKQARLAVAPALRTVWTEEVLPEVHRYIARWDGFDLDNTSTAALVQHIEDSWQWLGRIWSLHFQLPLGSSREAFQELCAELFEEEGAEPADPFEQSRLTQGLPCKTTEMGQALWQLSQGLPESVCRLIATTDAASVPDALRSSEEGLVFLTRLSQFLQGYGHRGNHWGLQYATWIEDPTPVIETLRGYLHNPDADPGGRFADQAAAREEAVADLRARLQGFPAPVRGRFEELLEQMQYSAVLKEDHNFWMDFSSTSRVRRVMLAAGRHLVEAGVIDRQDDVLHLHLAEILESLSGTTGKDRRLDIARRRAEIDHFATVCPPSRLGVEPPPKDGKGDEDRPEPPAEPGVLRGQPGAPGVVRGRARIVRELSAIQQLEPGDILVTLSTSPSFTPLFATAGGIVTEGGGLLSHCAVVAREYQIPAVVGLADARQQIKDGQWIEIDGRAGVVRIE